MSARPRRLPSYRRASMSFLPLCLNRLTHKHTHIHTTPHKNKQRKKERKREKHIAVKLLFPRVTHGRHPHYTKGHRCSFAHRQGFRSLAAMGARVARVASLSSEHAEAPTRSVR